MIPIAPWIYAANAALKRKYNLKKEHPPNLDGCLKMLILFKPQKTNAIYLLDECG